MQWNNWTCTHVCSFCVLLCLCCLQNVTVTMTSVSGHLLGLEFKAPFQKWWVKTGFVLGFIQHYTIIIITDVICIFSLRHSCNPVLLFDAEVEKYCPDNMVQIKVCLFPLLPGATEKNKWKSFLSVQMFFLIQLTCAVAELLYKIRVSYIICWFRVGSRLRWGIFFFLFISQQ